MKIKHETNQYGLCPHPCPHGVMCQVASMQCEQCPAFFGYEGEYILCKGLDK